MTHLKGDAMKEKAAFRIAGFNQKDALMALATILHAIEFANEGKLTKADAWEEIERVFID